MYEKLLKFVNETKPVEIKNQLVPKLENKNWTFVTDRTFRIMQITDVHIGCGHLSFTKSKKALQCVKDMVLEEKPDLVIVTGDIAYPVPFQSGTFNNKTSAKLFAKLMDKLGVYWALCLGNHDTEAYSYFSRKQIAKFYENKEFLKDKKEKSFCLFQRGKETVDGEGNYTINIKNTSGIITQNLIIIDSHSYIPSDFLGIMWKYDNIHQNQIDWYKSVIETSNAKNKAIDHQAERVKSLVFMHIPLREYKDAILEYMANSNRNSKNVKMIYGTAGERKNIVYHAVYPDKMFQTALELKSTSGFFCGHDHLNNFSAEYKGIRLTYGLSVDFLAYAKIDKYGLQRGSTIIKVLPNGSFDCFAKNYYKNNYYKNDYSNISFEPYYQ